MKIFVSMPFNSSFDRVFDKIKEVADKQKLQAYRVDKNYFEEPIPENISSEIKKCIIFIADITGNNPNVLNEVGQAQALNKTIIYFSQDPPENAPFNIRYFIINQYEINKLDKLVNVLTEEFSKASSKNEILRAMLVPNTIDDSMESRNFVIGVSPLSYRRTIGKSRGYKTFRATASDYVGLRGILQSFGSLYKFKTLPDIIDPEDFTDDVIKEKMTIYNIASPKTNRWTKILLDKFFEKRVPRFSFKADQSTSNLKNVRVSIYEGDQFLRPDGWEVNSEGDRYWKDFGIIVRGPNPYCEKEMMVVLAGRSSLGTEAACTAFTSHEAINEIRMHLSVKNVDLEDHKQAFWVLVSMNRNRDNREEADKGSLKIEKVDKFKPWL